MENSKKFTLEQARDLLPWLFEASKEAEAKLLKVRQNPGDPETAQAQIHQIIQHWAETVFKLGAIPKQPFTVDLDSGTDYFCWQFPERTLSFRHDYYKGFQGRHKIEE